MSEAQRLQSCKARQSLEVVSSDPMTPHFPVGSQEKTSKTIEFLSASQEMAGGKAGNSRHKR